MGLFQWLFRRKKRYPPFHWEPTPAPAPQEYVDSDGRRHRADAPYLLPKDDKEMARLDYQHFILRQILTGNTFAPVHDLLRRGGKVLDVGCGTGRWGHDIAAAYPEAQVIGLDLEVAASTASTTLNYQFRQGNVLAGLPFADHSFQYVHQRLLVAGIPLERWPGILAELRRVTALGGWIELVEMGNTFYHAGPATQQFLDWWVQISASQGIDASQMVHIGSWLARAGLVRIQTATKCLPVGRWGGRIGHLLAQDMLAGWPTMRPLAQSMLRVAPATFDEVIFRLEDEWNRYQTIYEVYFACGQV